MKTMLLALATAVILFAGETMVIHKTGGSTLQLSTSEIDSITFILTPTPFSATLTPSKSSYIVPVRL